MTGLWLAGASALWLGILTSLSPCPLATNIAALSFIARRFDRVGVVWRGGAAYAAGRTLTYVALAALVVGGLLSIPGLSMTLQRWGRAALGPALILIGIFLLGWIRLPGLGGDWVSRWQERVRIRGLFGAFLLGLLFALSFCPVSAALFFGALIPLAAQNESRLLLPALYGLGTALPVAILAGVVAAGGHALARFFNRLTQLERWARPATGVLFIAIGLYSLFR